MKNSWKNYLFFCVFSFTFIFLQMLNANSSLPQFILMGIQVSWLSHVIIAIKVSSMYNNVCMQWCVCHLKTIFIYNLWIFVVVRWRLIGNGKVELNRNEYMHWKAAEWVHSHGMAKYFHMDASGTLTVNDHGLFLIYAQVVTPYAMSNLIKLYCVCV